MLPTIRPASSDMIDECTVLDDSVTNNSGEGRLHRVWLSIDYDSCADILSDVPKWSPYEEWTAPLRKIFSAHLHSQMITGPLTTIACGSARQCCGGNAQNNLENQNGCAFTAFDELGRKMGTKVFRGLLADRYSSQAPGEEWKKALAGITYSGSWWASSDVQTKIDLVDYQMSQISSSNPTDFHFYDDRIELVEAVVNSPVLRKYSHIRLSGWVWDWITLLNALIKEESLEKATDGPILVKPRNLVASVESAESINPFD